MSDATVFEKDTAEVLRRCADWLTDNSDSLAKSFAGGCKDWSIQFSAGEDGIFPVVNISVNKVDRNVCMPYNKYRE